jgi:hypothetical protein
VYRHAQLGETVDWFLEAEVDIDVDDELMGRGAVPEQDLR